MKKLAALLLLLFSIAFLPHICQTQNAQQSVEDLRPKEFPREAFVEVIAVSIQDMANGSGSVIRHDEDSSIVLTAGHICHPPGSNPLTEPKIFRVGRNKTNVGAAILKSDKALDLCLLRTSEKLDRPAMSLAETGPTYGRQYYHLGSPLGVAGPDMVPILDGRYSGQVHFHKDRPDMDGYALPAKQGSSGGPIVNIEGGIVGVVSRIRRGYHHITLSPRFQDIRSFLESGVKEQP
jgi:S1-C subfamily serine protease